MLSKTDAATASRTQTSGTSSIFAPSRKPTSAAPRFARHGTRGKRERASERERLGGAAVARGGSKTMVIDVAEAAQLGASQNADPLRAQAQEERERKRQRESGQGATHPTVDGGTRSEGKEELTRKRQRDEEWRRRRLTGLKSRQSARNNAPPPKESNPATPSPVEEPAMWLQLAPQRESDNTKNQTKKGKITRCAHTHCERTQRAFVRACTRKITPKRVLGSIRPPALRRVDRHRRGSPKKPKKPDKTTKENLVV